jgi:hypothetical protein
MPLSRLRLRPRPRLRRAGAAGATAAAVSLALCASASGATASDTTISVSPRTETAAPADSPASFPGVTSVRQGTRLPRGWVVVGRDVRITRGGEPAFAALRMTCPKGKTWRSGTASGSIGVSVLSSSARGKRTVLVMATFSTADVRVGDSASGTIYALCR